MEAIEAMQNAGICDKPGFRLPLNLIGIYVAVHGLRAGRVPCSASSPYLPYASPPPLCPAVSNPGQS